jgi:hypothetical protein
MREWITLFFIAILCSAVFTIRAYAESSSLGLQLPNAGSTYGQDSIRTQEGLDCKNAIGGATQLEFGVTGIVDNYESPFGGSNAEGINSTKDVGVYARIVIPLDKPKQRINCNSLYELELRRKRIEVLKLQEELEALRRLNASGGQGNGFEN